MYRHEGVYACMIRLQSTLAEASRAPFLCLCVYIQCEYAYVWMQRRPGISTRLQRRNFCSCVRVCDCTCVNVCMHGCDDFDALELRLQELVFVLARVYVIAHM
jgi:hypothetical protein